MKIFVFIILILAFFSVPTLIMPATQEEIINNLEKYPEFQEYQRILFGNISNQEITWQEKCKKIISEYEIFIKTYPKSEFIDEAKLRIAENYQILSTEEENDKIRANYLYEVLRRLNEIIKKYPKSDYFALMLEYTPEKIKEQKGTKTAAWALYYRGAWFRRDNSINDWEQVLKEYPESKEPVFFSELALSKHKPKEQKKQPDNKPTEKI